MASHFNDVLQGWLNERYSIVRESSATFRVTKQPKMNRRCKTKAGWWLFDAKLMEL